MSSHPPPKIEKALLEKEGLDFTMVQKHQSRILDLIQNRATQNFTIQEACTSNNSGVISLERQELFLYDGKSQTQKNIQKQNLLFWSKNHLVGFFPAAGAGSRYLEKLGTWIEEVSPKVQNLGLHWYPGYLSEDCTRLSSHRKQEILNRLAVKNPLPLNLSLMEIHFGRWDPNGFLNALHLQLKQIPQKIPESVLLQFEDRLGSFLEKLVSLPETHSDLPQPSSGPHWDLLPRPSTVQMRFDYCSAALYPKPLKTTKSSPTWSLEIRSHLKQIGLSSAVIDNVFALCLAKAYLDLYQSKPKALVETTSENDTFFDLKIFEQIQTLPTLSNFLVVPRGQSSHFKDIIELKKREIQTKVQNFYLLDGTPFAPNWLNSSPSHGGWNVLEQHSGMCTIRFEQNGEPLKTEQGEYSVVSAGHGELLRLFGTITKSHPQAEAIHIRNIDNVIGSSADVKNSIHQLSDLFRCLRDALEYIRHGIKEHIDTMNEQDFIEDGILLESLKSLIRLLPDYINQGFYSKLSSVSLEHPQISAQMVWNSLSALFFWKVKNRAVNWHTILCFLDRPISVLGVVRREPGDVGGGPVFAGSSPEDSIKVCLEMPHASEADLNRFFGKEGKCTHFNPVLVFFELQRNKKRFESDHTPESGEVTSFDRLLDEDFWILAKKTFNQRKVYYHETVLYELIGNSVACNVVFAEVPRSLFTPHKSITDSFGKSRTDYGFDEFFKA